MNDSPNIFDLYERHIGTFGPAVADQLMAAEREYPAAWIEYAFSVAAQHNARSWPYVNTILRRLVHEGLPNGGSTLSRPGADAADTPAESREEMKAQYRRLFGALPWEK